MISGHNCQPYLKIQTFMRKLPLATLLRNQRQHHYLYAVIKAQLLALNNWKLTLQRQIITVKGR